MKKIDVTAKLGKDGTPETVKFNLGETLQELVEQYDTGEGGDKERGIIFNHARSSIIVALQSKMRSCMDPEREGGPLTGEALQAEIDKWRPGMRTPGKSIPEKVKEQLSKMDPELRRQLIASLKAEAGEGEEGEEERGELDALENQAEAEEAQKAPEPSSTLRRNRR